MSKVMFVVDGSWYATRIMAMVQDARQVPKSTLSIICRDMLLLGATDVVCAFDGPDNFRYEVYEDYKANRTGKELVKSSSKGGKPTISREERQIIMAAVRKYLAEAGLTVCAPKRYEADDVMRSIAHQADCKVVLGTVDKDLIQALIDDHVHMWTKTGGYLDVKKLKVPPERMLVYQTLHGDTIDNVPQLVTEAPAIRTANAFASINDYAHSSDESMEWCLQWGDELTRNHKLVKLVTDLDVPLSAPIEFRGHGWYPKSYNELRDFVRMQQNPNRLFHRRY